MQGIYKITNKINKSSYIGKSNNIERRFKDHQHLAFTENHKEYDKTLYNAFRKYGLNNFDFEIIEILEDYSISGEREKYWIAYYDTYNNGYNESLGGDGGSSIGHCSGEDNGRAKLTQLDVIDIRTKYQKGISKNECYQSYKNKISLSGFTRVWNGQTWKNIMPEVYTEENKQKNLKIGRGISSKRRRLFTDEEILEIRQAKKNGIKLSIAYKKYGKNASKETFRSIWYGNSYKEIK